MQQCIDAFFSNQLDILYQNLKSNLFGSDSDPFKRRLIVVYGPAMKSWLQLRMAQDPDLSIAMGIEILYLNEAFDTLRRLFYIEKEKSIPSQLELALAIECEITSITENFNNLPLEQQKLWQPLIHYLKGPSARAEKRLVSLSQSLARCFHDYGRFGGTLVHTWESNSHSEGWQQQLWTRIFNDEQEWTYPSKTFQQPIQKIPTCALHFFSISFVTPAEFQFLKRLSKHISISYYLLSPCAVFWSDIRSERERSHLHAYWQKRLGEDSRQLHELELLLQECNPLLANFGKIGREMALQIEDSCIQTRASYQLMKPPHIAEEEIAFSEDIRLTHSSQPLSLLQLIQADILLMYNPEGKPQVPLQKDDLSIQLHIAPCKRREVEILYHNLLNLIDKKHPHLCPSDIIVMTPAISEYIPYIQSIFGGESSRLDFQILDMGLNAKSDIIQGFTSLLKLGDSRWDASSFLQLLGHRSFQRKHQLTSNDVEEIQQWIESIGVRWGENTSHRNAILKKDHCSHGMADETPIGTWDYAIDRLISGLTTYFEEGDYDHDGTLPYQNIAFSQAELLEKWIKLFHSLREDLLPLQHGTQKSVDEWVFYFNTLLEKYFQPDFDNTESVEEYDTLKDKIGRLKSSALVIKKGMFPSISIMTHLEDLLEQSTTIYRENLLNTVRFCSMIPLRSIPAKVIALLGMEEGAFPRHQPLSALNLLQSRQSSLFYPSSADYDRYLFLETLHSAREALLISYQSQHSEDKKEVRPCLVVEELFSYLDKTYSVEGSSVSDHCIFRHPYDSFDKAYFEPNSRFVNFSQNDYKAALVLSCSHTKAPPHRFLNDFTNTPQFQILPDKTVIEIRHLKAAAVNPIKLTLNRGFEIYLEKEEDRLIKREEELVLSVLDRHMMKREALKSPVNIVKSKAEKEGKLPFGVFKSVALKKFDDDVNEIQRSLGAYGINSSEIYDLELCLSCTTPCQKGPRHWMLPALELNYEGGHQIKIVGKLSPISSKGIITIGKGALTDGWKIWPEFLLFHCAVQTYHLPFEPHWIATEAKQAKQPFFDSAESHLKQFVNYYSHCLRGFSPLMPDWISAILENNPDELQKKMNLSYNDYLDNTSRYAELHWVLSHSSLSDAQQAINHWKPEAERLLGEMVRNWYPAKKESNE